MPLSDTDALNEGLDLITYRFSSSEERAEFAKKARKVGVRVVSTETLAHQRIETKGGGSRIGIIRDNYVADVQTKAWTEHEFLLTLGKNGLTGADRDYLDGLREWFAFRLPSVWKTAGPILMLGLLFLIPVVMGISSLFPNGSAGQQTAARAAVAVSAPAIVALALWVGISGRRTAKARYEELTRKYAD